MKVLIDFSILTQDPVAFGNIVGSVDVEIAPAVGDALWFLNSSNGARMPACGFGGRLIVEARSLTVNPQREGIALSLSDLTVPTTSDARAIAEYFERGFGLFLNEYLDS